MSKDPMFGPGVNPNPAADNIVIPAHMIPGYRTSVALHRGTERNILLKTWGGLGDQICAEPTLRYAIASFPDCDVSLASEQPSLFEHLKFKDVFDLKREQPIWDKYFVFDTILPTEHLQWQFMSHMLIHCVDYPSLCAFRCQLPVSYRPICMPTEWSELPTDIRTQVELLQGHQIAVHAGRHWPSKTFPAAWWNGVLDVMKDSGITPILIGANTDDNRSTVDVDASGCLDLRNKCTVRQTMALLHGIQGLITNDSSPLHMAASGSAWISYIATVKHPDFIQHWRRPYTTQPPQWAWGMKNYGKGGMWNLYSNLPNNREEIRADKVPEGILESWLPPPQELVLNTLDEIDQHRIPAMRNGGWVPDRKTYLVTRSLDILSGPAC